MNRERDEFLTCRNCVNWGQAWKLGRSTIVCSECKDDDDNYYTPSHAACEYFVPIQGELPPDLQRLRLFVQSLSKTQHSYLKWAVSQADLIVNHRDSKGRDLALGDYVQFRFGLHGYVGTVEGQDPDNSSALIISCPAFTKGSVSLVSSTLQKIDPLKAKELIKEGLSEEEKRELEWHLECYQHEISTLRSKPLTPKEREFLLDCEQKFSEIEARLRYNTLLTTY